jgi:hypothetical protein
LGYLTIEAEEGLFRGAALIVDYRGIPIDFRYTDPIRPTRLEKILYGSALDVYLKEELILESLIEAVEIRPALWICREQSLLLPIRALSKDRTVFLASSSRSPLNATGDHESAGEPAAYFIQVDSVSAPVRVVFPGPPQETELKSTVNLFVGAARTMELLEPFTRIYKALAAIGEENAD